MSTTNHLKYFLLTATLFAAMALSVRPFSLLLRNHFPDNYSWQVNRAIDAGNLQQAEQILKFQMTREHYDFTVHRLYAQILIQQKRPAEAAKLLQLSIERERAVSGRKVFNRGYNSYEAHDLLSQALAAAGDHAASSQASKRANENFALRGAGILSQHNYPIDSVIDVPHDRTIPSTIN